MTPDDRLDENIKTHECIKYPATVARHPEPSASYDRLISNEPDLQLCYKLRLLSNEETI